MTVEEVLKKKENTTLVHIFTVCRVKTCPEKIHVLVDFYCLFNVVFNSFPFCPVYPGDLGNSDLSQFEGKYKEQREKRGTYNVHLIPIVFKEPYSLLSTN